MPMVDDAFGAVDDAAGARRVAAVEPSDGVRVALLAAVVQVVGESGLVGLTNRKVGSVAGVDNSLITYYFGSRDGLLEAATEWARIGNSTA